MITLLNDLALLHHDNVVSMPDGGEPVSDHYGCDGA
jgi:hypothetical protein